MKRGKVNRHGFPFDRRNTSSNGNTVEVKNRPNQRIIAARLVPSSPSPRLASSRLVSSLSVCKLARQRRVQSGPAYTYVHVARAEGQSELVKPAFSLLPPVSVPEPHRVSPIHTFEIFHRPIPFPRRFLPPPFPRPPPSPPLAPLFRSDTARYAENNARDPTRINRFLRDITFIVRSSGFLRASSFSSGEPARSHTPLLPFVRRTWRARLAPLPGSFSSRLWSLPRREPADEVMLRFHRRD